jgi:hypothetical protein
MKVAVFSALTFAVVLQGCSESNNDKIRKFVPGIYVRHFRNEYSTGSDTLKIIEHDAKAGIYFIDEKEGYQQQLDGKVFPAQYKATKHTALYNESTHQLTIQNTEDIITVLPDKNKLLLGRTEYQKVK